MYRGTIDLHITMTMANDSGIMVIVKVEALTKTDNLIKILV